MKAWRVSSASRWWRPASIISTRRARRNQRKAHSQNSPAGCATSRAERYFSRDPITSLIWTRQFGEYLAQLVAARSGLLIDVDESQLTLLNCLGREAGYPSRVIDLFNDIRRAGNSAVHERHGDHQAALSCLRKCRDLGIWFHLTFGDRRQQLGAFVVPSDELHTREEVERLNGEIETARAAARDAIAAAEEVKRRLETEVGDRETWQNLAVEAEREKARLLTELLALQEKLQEARGQALATGLPPPTVASELSEGTREYLEDRLVVSVSRSTDAFVSLERRSRFAAPTLLQCPA